MNEEYLGIILDAMGLRKRELDIHPISSGNTSVDKQIMEAARTCITPEFYTLYLSHDYYKYEEVVNYFHNALVRIYKNKRDRIDPAWISEAMVETVECFKK